MADYTTLTTLKARLNITDTVDDAALTAAITAASRVIDAATGRYFYKQAAGTRYFTPDDWNTLILNEDLQAVTTFQTDITGARTYDTSWSATDYDLEPYSGPPYTRLCAAPRGYYTFPRIPKAVKIVGDWGYCATGSHPQEVEEATIIQAIRLFKRKDAPFGLLGTPELGVARIPKVDTDVAALVAHLRRLDGLFA